MARASCGSSMKQLPQGAEQSHALGSFGEKGVRDYAEGKLLAGIGTADGKGQQLRKPAADHGKQLKA